MLTVTQNLMLPTAITGSYPRPLWFDLSLNGRSFKSALGEFAVPRTVPRRGRRDHQRAGGRGPRHRHRRRQPVRSRGRRQIVVLLSDRAHRRHRGPSRHLARLDEPARPASRQDPVGGAGGVSARHREAQAGARTAGIHRDLAGRAAHVRPSGEVRRDLRAGAGQHAVERVLPRRQAADARPLRHHERRVPRDGRCRLSADPGGGAAASRALRCGPTAPRRIWSS